MTLLYLDPRFQQHQTGHHPERPLRLERIERHLRQTGLDRFCPQPQWQPAQQQQLLPIHDPDYIDHVRTFAARGGGSIEADTVVSAESFDVARLAAGAVCDATGRVINGPIRSALCLVRPPGHHALRRSPMGFCLFNNVAVAAKLAVNQFGLRRVLIVDWDVHHGNGTQDAFWEDEQVAVLSIHRSPFYPFTGEANETGSGAGLGTVRNLPTAFGTPRKDYLKWFRDELEDFANRMAPQLVLISAGFDSHRLDPIGSLGLEVEDYAELTVAVQEVADAHAEGRLVSVLEGGYNVDVLPQCVAAHLQQLLAHEGKAAPASEG